jgi:hypothetical protein
MTPCSRIGSYAARVNLGEDELLIALRAYLDSSGKLNDNWITLAAVAASDGMWGEFEGKWKEILDGHTPKGEYIHMKEIYRLEKAFAKELGWTHDNAFGLVNNCLSYMSVLDKKRFRMFYCKIDLNAWQKLRNETYQIPSPVELCNKFCAETILGWYLLHYPDLIDPQTDTVKYFFDRNEYFYQPFFDKWNRELNLAEQNEVWSIWKVIEEVAPAIMQKTPGIQAADIIAWGMNRETFAQEGDLAKYLGHILRQVIPSIHVVWDETKMRQEFKRVLYL